MTGKTFWQGQWDKRTFLLQEAQNGQDMGFETEQDPVGVLPVTDPFHGPISTSQEIGFIQPPRPSLSSKGQIQTVANEGRKGDAETKEEQSRNNSAY